MFIIILASMGAALFLDRRIQQEYDGAPGFFEQRKMKALMKGYFDHENERFDQELAQLLSRHRSLVRQSERLPEPIHKDLYQEAMEELERDLAQDPLSKAFESLEESLNVKKTKKSL